MKKDVIVVALIGILFVLVAGSILANFTFYKEYKDKVDSLEQQSMAGKTKIDSIETKVDSFKAAIDDISNQVKTYSDNFKAIQNSVNLSDEERKALLTKIEEMKKDLVDWQKDYSTTVIDVKQSMLMLKDDLDKMHGKAKDTDLGKITVKQDDKKSVAQDTSVKKTAASSNNFKSGSVRKISSN